MPTNPYPEPTKTRAVLDTLERRISGWHVAMFLLGIIIGFIVGYAV